MFNFIGNVISKFTPNFSPASNEDIVINNPPKVKATPLVPHEVKTTHNEQRKVINEIANDCFNKAFEDLKEAFEDLCFKDYNNYPLWKQRQEKGLETVKRVLSTEDKGKKAFKELLRSTIDATPEKQIDICSKLIRLPLNNKIDSIKAIEVIFWGLQSLEEEKIIPTMNINQFKNWGLNSENRHFYSTCFQSSHARNPDNASKSNKGNKDNLAAILYTLKEIPNDDEIVDEYLHPVYKPIIKNCLERPIREKEMFCFLLAEKRIIKLKSLKLPKFLKLEIFNYLVQYNEIK